MRAGRFIGAVGVALAVGAAGVTWSCGRSGRGGGTRQDYKPQTRENIIVLLPNGNSCRAIKPDPVRGYRKDKIRWTVVDACGGVTKVRIDFTGSAGSPDENGKPEDSFNNGRAELFVKIKDNPPGTPNSEGVLTFPYRISIVRNGASQTLEDPDLEVDPWSF